MPGVGPSDQPLAGVLPGYAADGSCGLAGGGQAPTAPTSDDFLAVFPEFSAVPVARINFYLSLAVESLRPSFWQDRYASAVMLYTAHYLAMSARVATATGALPLTAGAATGIVSSRSVGGVSKGVDTSSGQTEGGGALNLTIYGQQYLTMRDGGFGAFQL